MNKKLLSERDICTKFITPAVKRAGWDELTQIREEVSLTKGRIIAKVDKLKALCDRLEAQVTTTQAESRHLLEVVLQQALAPVA
jgi:type I site-specific restriction endonuclease